VTAEPFRVNVDDSLLRGTRWAGQRPAVVLLHAGVCDRHSWDEVGPRLSPAHEVLAYDRADEILPQFQDVKGGR
jgi:hypothetical protein